MFKASSPPLRCTPSPSFNASFLSPLPNFVLRVHWNIDLGYRSSFKEQVCVLHLRHVYKKPGAVPLE